MLGARGRFFSENCCLQFEDAALILECSGSLSWDLVLGEL